MKAKIYMLLLITASIVFSCSNEDTGMNLNLLKVKLTKNELLSISYYDVEELNDQDIFKLVSSFNKALNRESTRSTVTSYRIAKRSYINEEGEFKNKEIATRSATRDDQITSEICEVVFRNGDNDGLAIVAADSRRPAVIAFIPKSTEESRIKSGAADLIQGSKATYLYEAINTKQLVDSLRLPTLEKISKKLNIPIEQINYERIKDHIIIIDSENTTRSTAKQDDYFDDIRIDASLSILPLVETNWGQDAPYNEALRDQGVMDWVAVGNGCTYQAVPAGCVNIALAQIMTHTHDAPFCPTFTIPGTNSTFLPEFYKMKMKPKLDDPGTNSTGRFHATWVIYNLYMQNETKSDKNSFNWVTGSSVAEENMLKTMNKYFSYDPKAPFNGDACWASLRAKNPVLMLTSDHAFIISGILVTEKTFSTRQLVKTNDVYWHANFGWADNETGYYKLDGNANTKFEAGGKVEWCYRNNYIKNIRKK